jgi:hypothetical protein
VLNSLSAKLTVRFGLRALIGSVSVLLVSFATVIGQREKQWSKDEAQKILYQSPWSQTQVDTDVSELFYSPTRAGTASIARTGVTRSTNEQQSINNDRADRGATNQAVFVNYRVRLLSARPVRQAFKRVIEMTQNTENPELREGLEAFVKRDFSRFIVIAITFDSLDSRFSGPVLQAFNSAGLMTFRNKAYLERKDGKRVFVMEYHAPINDGLGAKFVFPRSVDERSFIEPDSGSFRFYCELNSQIKINVSFKVRDLLYEGRLEY